MPSLSIIYIENFKVTRLQKCLVYLQLKVNVLPNFIYLGIFKTESQQICELKSLSLYWGISYILDIHFCKPLSLLFHIFFSKQFNKISMLDTRFQRCQVQLWFTENFLPNFICLTFLIPGIQAFLQIEERTDNQKEAFNLRLVCNYTFIRTLSFPKQ